MLTLLDNRLQMDLPQPFITATNQTSEWGPRNRGRQDGQVTFPIHTQTEITFRLAKKSDLYGAGEMAWWLGPLAAPAEDLDLFPTSKWRFTIIS